MENVNAQVDELIHTGVLRRLLAFTELKFSNLEAFEEKPMASGPGVDVSAQRAPR